MFWLEYKSISNFISCCQLSLLFAKLIEKCLKRCSMSTRRQQSTCTNSFKREIVKKIVSCFINRMNLVQLNGFMFENSFTEQFISWVPQKSVVYYYSFFSKMVLNFIAWIAVVFGSCRATSQGSLRGCLYETRGLILY
jgi:hypothetical protein